MYALKKNSMKIPHGGHHFSQCGITFKAETFDQLKDKVHKFRVINSLPIGKPDQDILNFYAENWPWLVERVEDQHGNEDVNMTGWRDWVLKTWSKPPVKTLSKAEAATRWKICEKCPFNRAIDFWETEEVKELKKKVFLLKRGIDTPSNLGFCAIHRADIGVLSILDSPEKFSSKRKKGGSYKDCWTP